MNLLSELNEHQRDALLNMELEGMYKCDYYEMHQFRKLLYEMAKSLANYSSAQGYWEHLSHSFLPRRLVEQIGRGQHKPGYSGEHFSSTPCSMLTTKTKVLCLATYDTFFDGTKYYITVHLAGSCPWKT